MNVESPAWLVLLALFLSAGLLSAQEPDAYRIDNLAADTVFYCNDPVAVAPVISIENINILSASDGIKISIANFRKGEDILVYQGNKFNHKWDSTYGNLELTGVGTAGEYEAAVKQVFYENLAANPVQVPRSFSISLLDADYLPYTDHFYRYIEKLDITWKEARDSAANMEYFGLQGYLATITSAVENDFIWDKIDGVGWIGASDESVEGVWRWVTGPEAGTQFWQGTYQNGYSVNNMFSYWSEGEPNNSGPEHFAHINQAPGKRKKSWNDLRNESDGPNSQYYRSQGFVVEFGDMQGDPDVQLSASAVVAWSQKPEMRLDDFNPLMCGENRQQLNLQFKEEVSTLLHPLDPQSSVDDQFSSAPAIRLDEFGMYRFVIETTNRHQCIYTDTIKVKYQHKPEAKFQIDEAECEGYNLRLEFDGETLGDARFDWYSNDTIYHSGMNITSMEIPLGYGSLNRSVGLKINEEGCVDSLKLPVTVTPFVDFWPENPEGCTPLNVQFDYSATEPIDDFLWEFGDGSNSTDEKPSHVFQNDQTEDKIFDVSLKIVSAEGCENSGTLKDLITVHPIPTLDFDFEEAVCYSENAVVNYKGSADSSDTFIWDLSYFHSDEIVETPGNTCGPFRFSLATRPTAEIGLQVVSQFGCKTDALYKIFKRKPVFDVPSDTVGSCPPLETTISLSTTDTVDSVNYLWDSGNGHTGEGDSFPNVYTESNQNYNVTIIATSSFTGCADTLLLPGKIFVYPVPEAAFSANPPAAIISEPVIRFENLSEDAILFEWDFGDRTPGSAAEHPEHRYAETGRYDVNLLVVNDFGCFDSTSNQVSVAYDRVFPPNAFSPNATKEEDREFRIYSEGITSEGYKLLIFNRWGEVIFESNSRETGWNGQMKNGVNAPAGVYLWVLQYYDFLGNKNKQQGTVTLLF